MHVNHKQDENTIKNIIHQHKSHKKPNNHLTLSYIINVLCIYTQKYNKVGQRTLLSILPVLVSFYSFHIYSFYVLASKRTKNNAFILINN